MPIPSKSPGVYIVEKNAIPRSSIVEVATAVPAFIGYTAMADNKGIPLVNKPWRISSLVEYHSYFGMGPEDIFDLESNGQPVLVSPAFRLYRAIRLFFQNGGGACLVVSVGNYSEPLDKSRFLAAFQRLEKEREPTLIVVPEAVSFQGDTGIDDCTDIQNEAIAHCARMGNRFAILDVYEGYKEPAECIEKYRGTLEGRLDFAAAYYPWLKTYLVVSTEVSFTNFSDAGLENLKTLLLADVAADADPSTPDPVHEEVREAIGKLAHDLSDEASKNLHEKLLVISPKYGPILDALREAQNLLPPSAAVAGLYATVDSSRGVWKPPANIVVDGAIAPAVDIASEAQQKLTLSADGKSINAIRSIAGEGILVWGARTLDGNSLDWRYVNVRRTMIMIEESIKLASSAYVFEPNETGTWITVKTMIGNFLTGLWKRGALVGLTPDDAFGVKVGLGETMAPDDILEGILRVTVLVALSRPAEFLEITLQQQMQKS